MDLNNASDRSRQLGKVLETSRENAEKTLVKTAAFLGVSPDDLLRFERGETTPSLPQLEVLAEFFRVSVHDFIDPATRMQSVRKLEAEKVPSLVDVRSRIIAIQLKSARISQNIPLADLASSIGVTSDELEVMEAGDIPVPFSVLEKACERLSISITSLLSSSDIEEKADLVEDKSDELPGEWVEFLKDPANVPYLKLACGLKTIDPAVISQLGAQLSGLASQD